MIFISFFFLFSFNFLLILFYSVLHEETIAYLEMGGSCESKYEVGESCHVRR